MSDAFLYFYESVLEEFIQSSATHDCTGRHIKRVLSKFPTAAREVYCIWKAFGLFFLLLFNQFISFACAICENEEYLCCLIFMIIFFSNFQLRSISVLKIML